MGVQRGKLRFLLARFYDTILMTFLGRTLGVQRGKLRFLLARFYGAAKKIYLYFFVKLVLLMRGFQKK